MSKPAAVLGDAAAHAGTIGLGSPNVLICGRPAARVGDPVACGVHGTGAIVMGATTVFINGTPAARMGDPTGCLTPGIVAVSTPIVLGPPPVHYKYSNDGQSNAEADEKGKPTFAHAEAQITDENRDGNPDAFDGTVALVRFRDKGYQNAGPVEISGTNEFDAASVTAKGHARTTSKGFGFGASAEATAIRYGGSIAVAPKGAKGLNQTVNIGGEVKGPAAKAAVEVLSGDDGTREGTVYKMEVGAQLASFETSQAITIPLPNNNTVQIRQKGGASVGPAGIAEGFWSYRDKKTGRQYVGIMGKLRLLFGLEGEAEINYGPKLQEDPPAPASPPAPELPVGGFRNVPGLGSGGIPGTILSGQPTVLIGG
jgi:uncharacterized Zn-binding protein involved in type VI secretion